MAREASKDMQPMALCWPVQRDMLLLEARSSIGYNTDTFYWFIMRTLCETKHASYISIVCKCNTDNFSLMPGYSNAIVAYKTNYNTFYRNEEQSSMLSYEIPFLSSNTSVNKVICR